MTHSTACYVCTRCGSVAALTYINNYFNIYFFFFL